MTHPDPSSAEILASNSTRPRLGCAVIRGVQLPARVLILQVPLLPQLRAKWPIQVVAALQSTAENDPSGPSHTAMYCVKPSTQTQAVPSITKSKRPPRSWPHCYPQREITRNRSRPSRNPLHKTVRASDAGHAANLPSENAHCGPSDSTSGNCQPRP